MKQTATLILCAALPTAFSFNSLLRNHRNAIHLHLSSVETSDALEISSTPSSSSGWATNALLFSSWTDGIVPNPAAKSFLRYSIVNKLLQDHVLEKEDSLETSVKFSPCNMDALQNLDTADNLSNTGKLFTFENFDEAVATEVDLWSKETMQYISSETGQATIKLLYIPTAMYALNPQSSNTAGKQRQRARADGKKRRTQVLNLLNTLISDDCSENLSIQTITLDLDDDSLKQPEGSDCSTFPKDGKEALSSWNPTIIYVEGGNTFWLQHCIDKGDYSQLIIDACTGVSGAVYCGKSAGAIVAGDDMSTATWKGWDDPSVVPNRETYDDWIGTKGFQFAENESYFPHMNDDWTQLVDDKVKGKETGSTCCLREEDVCCIVGDKKKTFVVSGHAPES